jgi:hypothetical protein
MKFPAKSSKERSYKYFRPLSAASGWKAATHRDEDWKKDIQDHCATKGGNHLQVAAVMRARFAHGVPGNKWG